MGIAIPAALTGISASGSSITPLIASLIIYISRNTLYFPFHQLNTLGARGRNGRIHK